MKLPKFFLYLFTVCLLLTSVSCRKNLKSLQDGTFIGKGSGRNGQIEVAVTIFQGKIVDAKIISEKETPEITKGAKEAILAQFVKDGSTALIDTVSGATITSNAILDALDEALLASMGSVKPKIVYKDTECDIVIIGAGGAGLTAATEAANGGARVIVLEKMDIVGGNTNFATGGINAAYTKEQQQLGIKDSKESFYNDTLKGGQYLNNPELIHKLVDESAGIVEWLQSPLIGADLSDVSMFGGASTKRIHRPKGGAAIGAHLVPLLYKAAVSHGAEVRLNNKVIDVLENEGKACGVKVATPHGSYTITAKAVIVASGGFAANPDLVTFYQASLQGFATTNHKGATGDAFEMLKKFDVDLVQMEQIQTHPTVAKDTEVMITEAIRGNGAILVNISGKRFVNEMENRDIVSAGILKNPGKTAFLLFDQGIRDSLAAIETYAAQNLLTEGASLKELADKLRIDGVALEYTVQEYNRFIEQKNDENFHRNPASMERSLLTPPYFAIEVEPAVHHTMGGVKINTEAQVINKSGAVIPGLFAAGEVTGGIHGGNRLGGNAIADICIFGKVAADSALSYIKQ